MRVRTPKILPWLARSAGLPVARVEELWRDAIRYATAKTGWVNTPEYWKVANERLLRLIENEAAACHPPQLTPWVTINMHLASLPMIAANGIALVWSTTFGRLGQPVRRTTDRRAA